MDATAATATQTTMIVARVMMSVFPVRPKSEKGGKTEELPPLPLELKEMDRLASAPLMSTDPLDGLAVYPETDSSENE